LHVQSVDKLKIDSVKLNFICGLKKELEEEPNLTIKKGPCLDVDENILKFSL
jgi:hypothetical protein